MADRTADAKPTVGRGGLVALGIVTAGIPIEIELRTELARMSISHASLTQLGCISPLGAPREQ